MCAQVWPYNSIRSVRLGAEILPSLLQWLLFAVHSLCVSIVIIIRGRMMQNSMQFPSKYLNYVLGKNLHVQKKTG